MYLARLLAVALLSCPLAVLAQANPAFPASGHELRSPVFDNPGFEWKSPTISTSEPWRIISRQPPAATASPTPLDQFAMLQKEREEKIDAKMRDTTRRYFATHHVDLNSQRPVLTFSPDGDLLSVEVETFCLSMRSYRVARDSKDSDSTHLVSYTTCQPASRYGLKTTEIRSVPQSQ